MKKLTILCTLAALGYLSAFTAPAMSAPPTPTIAGKWNLIEWSEWPLKRDNVHAWIQFGPNGDFELYDNCSKYSGRYVQASTSLTISNVTKVSGGCPAQATASGDYVAKYFAIEIEADGIVGVTGGKLRINNMRSENFLFQSDAPVQSGASPNPSVLGQKEIRVTGYDIYKFTNLEEITGHRSPYFGRYHMACTVAADFKLTDCGTDPAEATVIANRFNNRVRVGPNDHAKYPVGSRVGFDLESD